MAKKFFYVCAGILMLALSYHFGASSAGAQASGSSIVAAFVGDVQSEPYYAWAFTASGDVYGWRDGSWHLHSSVLAGPTPAQPTSFGELKARYRK
jgi:hypothetical protein